MNDDFAPRTSVVTSFKANGVIFSSCIFVGDLAEFAPVTNAIAIQREVPNFQGNEGDLRQFPIFSAEIPLPLRIPVVSVETRHEEPYIKVGDIRVIAVSTSALCHIGSIRRTQAQSRIKHIRQLLTGDRKPT